MERLLMLRVFVTSFEYSRRRLHFGVLQRSETSTIKTSCSRLESEGETESSVEKRDNAVLALRIAILVHTERDVHGSILSYRTGPRRVMATFPSQSLVFYCLSQEKFQEPCVNLDIPSSTSPDLRRQSLSRSTRRAALRILIEERCADPTPRGSRLDF